MPLEGRARVGVPLGGVADHPHADELLEALPEERDRPKERDRPEERDRVEERDRPEERPRRVHGLFPGPSPVGDRGAAS